MRFLLRYWILSSGSTEQAAEKKKRWVLNVSTWQNSSEGNVLIYGAYFVNYAI